jgi:DNA-binding transcriptional regulator YdaS (Cro superfamily)
VAGGGAKLARAVGVTKFAVYQWQRDGIPAARLPAVERITGIPMRDLRPDLWIFPPESVG